MTQTTTIIPKGVVHYKTQLTNNNLLLTTMSAMMASQQLAAVSLCIVPAT